jgi:lantibiotic modifying enzyme
MPSDGLFLDAAASIGRSIVADAVWHNGRCSWMGAITRPSESTATEYRALGPSLYGGTAGVGLFLAQIANATADRSFRRTAVGALRHATALPRQSPRDGFHAGPLGVAWAAARAGLLLEEGELHALAVALSAQPDIPSGANRCPDLIRGMAGSVLGLLALADELGDPGLVGQARATGEILLSCVTVTSHGWSCHPRQALSRAPMRHLARRSRDRVGAA